MKPLLQRQHTVGDPVVNEGTTPFIRAARFGDVAVMRLLLEHGANPHLMQKNHTTALMVAAGLGSDRATQPSTAPRANASFVSWWLTAQN